MARAKHAPKLTAKGIDSEWGDGSIRVRNDGGADRFRVRWRENGERHSKTFGSYQEASDELAKVKARIALGQPGAEPEPAPAPAPTGAAAIVMLVEEWVEHRRKFDVRTADEDVARWNLHLAAPLATTTLEAIDARWVRELAGELVKPEVGSKAPDGEPKRPVSGPTAHRILSLLSSFFRWAVREGHAASNPAAIALTDPDVKRLVAPKSDEHEDGEPLESWDEVEQLFAALEKINRSVAIWYLLQARCGLRPGEARAVLWSDVDLRRGIVWVRRQVRAGKAGPVKGNKALDVPLAPVVAERLKSWRKVSTGEVVCPTGVRLKKDGKPGTQYAGHLGDKACEAAMEKAFAATGIKARTAYECGRVSFCTLLGNDPRVPPIKLQRWARHKDIKTTLRYVRRVDEERGALAALAG